MPISDFLVPACADFFIEKCTIGMKINWLQADLSYIHALSHTLHIRLHIILRTIHIRQCHNSINVSSCPIHNVGALNPCRCWDHRPVRSDIATTRDLPDYVPHRTVVNRVLWSLGDSPLPDKVSRKDGNIPTMTRERSHGWRYETGVKLLSLRWIYTLKERKIFVCKVVVILCLSTCVYVYDL